jgi:arylamine N-acetyltransferase
MDTTAYLRRIRYEGPLDPSSATLRAPHRAHLHAVPFENLDIQLRRPIGLHEAVLFDKIVVRRRSGICYELNGLFAALLRTLGFSVTLQPRQMADFTAMCQYHQTSPDSWLTQERLCTLAKPDGRVTLSNGRLITTVSGVRQQRLLRSEEERVVLSEQFGIDLET